MLYTLHLGLGDPSHQLAHLLSTHTPKDALLKLSESLLDASQRLQKLLGSAKIKRGMTGSLFVELDEIPEGLEDLLEPAFHSDTEEFLEEILRALELPQCPVPEDLQFEFPVLVNAGEYITFSRPLTPHALADGFARIERNDVRVCAVLMGSEVYVDLRKSHGNVIDISTQPYLLKKGIQGWIWGATIITNRKFTANEILIVGEAEVPAVPGRNEAFNVWFQQKLVEGEIPTVREIKYPTVELSQGDEFEFELEPS